MIKIREPKHAPHSVICHYPNVPSHEPKPDPRMQQQFVEKVSPPSQVQAPVAQKSINAILKAKCVSQPPSEVVQEIGAKFTLAWTFQNVGETAWPQDVLFFRANGDEIECDPWVADLAVAAGAQVPILVDFTAPQKPGKYFACYRLGHGDNNRFGDKVFLNLTVQDTEAAFKKVNIVQVERNQKAGEVLKK
jgi:hypothetical protein